MKRLTACALAAAACVCAQDAAIFRSNVEEALIPLVVVDARGAPVAGLGREDFRVSDNGVRRIIDHLWPAADLPLTLGILIDRSDSQGGQLEEHRRTALALLAGLLRPGDRAFVLSIGEQVRMWSEPSSSLSEIGARLSGSPLAALGEACPATTCGASPIWNAVFEAARQELAAAEGNRALVLLTDGYDTGSTHTWRQAAAEAQKAGAAVYAIAYPSQSGAHYAPDLYRLVSETGGATFQPPSTGYDAILARLETDLRSGYVIAFRPEGVSGKVRHEVEVEATRPDLTVRARKFYFRPPR